MEDRDDGPALILRVEWGVAAEGRQMAIRVISWKAATDLSRTASAV